MTVEEAIDKMSHGSKVTCANGILGNSTSVFHMNTIGIIIETFKVSKRKTEIKMLSYRRFLTLGANIDFELIQK